MEVIILINQLRIKGMVVNLVHNLLTFSQELVKRETKWVIVSKLNRLDFVTVLGNITSMWTMSL